MLRRLCGADSDSSGNEAGGEKGDAGAGEGEARIG
jgi:hypothetical protein